MTAVKACRILGVPSRTTWSDVRQAYLDLVKVWHPDRFQSDPSLQARAAKRLAEINEAYEFLRDVHTSRRSSNASRPRIAPKSSPPPQTSNPESSPPRPPESVPGQEARGEPMDQGERVVQLGEAIYQLRECAEELSTYGESKKAQVSLRAIPPEDRALFLYLAMLEGSDDSRFVASYLARSTHASLTSIDHVYASLCEEHKLLVADPPNPITIDSRRIADELRRTCAVIGNLRGEEAYWIVIPGEPVGDSEWIPVGQTGAYSYVRSPFFVMQDPTNDVRADAADLIGAAKAGRWLLNVHNHPDIPGYLVSSEPSDADYRVVEQWRSLAPTLSSRMRFFVVRGSMVVEYGLRERKTRRWMLGPGSPTSDPCTATKPSTTPQTSNTASSPPRPPENARGQQARAEPSSRPIPDADQIKGGWVAVGRPAGARSGRERPAEIRRVVLGAIVALAVLVVFGVFLGTQEGFAPSSSADAPDAATRVAPAQVASPSPLPSLPPVGSDLTDFLARQAPSPFLSTDPRAVDSATKSEPLPIYKAVYAQTVPGVERPESGAELIVAAETGLGSLNVRNGTSPDAVVILYQGDVQRRAAYIRASDAAAIPEVAAGTYNVRFTSGRWWNGEEFLKEATFSEFERPLVFAETQEKDGIAYSDFKLTLNRVIGGNARTRPTPPFKLSKQIPLEGR